MYSIRREHLQSDHAASGNWLYELDTSTAGHTSDPESLRSGVDVSRM